MLKTKSIQEGTEKSDGVRICIMRRIKPEFQFDIWIPTLAPSTELLNEYHKKKINWDEFEKRFRKEVLLKEKKYLNLILYIAKKNIVTLLCWEETAEKCHRRLVAERIKELYPEVKVKIS